MRTSIIELKNLWVSYPLGKKRKLTDLLKRKPEKKEFWALKDINFDVKKGEVLGIIGRNGSGKSTLLKILSGLILPDKGEYIVKEQRPVLLSLGAGFDGELSGIENIYLNSLLLGHKKEEVDKKLNNIIEFSELGDFVYQPVRTYSSGMRSRLAFSIAISLDPDILLIDEVLGVGDQAFREKSEKAILEKIKQDKTVIIVTHSASLVNKICDRVVWIHLGEQKAIGPTAEIIPLYNKFMNGRKTK